MTSEAYYLKGNEERRKGNFHAAINYYMEALALDPDSPAKVAKEALEEILSFRNNDAYNP